MNQWCNLQDGFNLQGVVAKSMYTNAMFTLKSKLHIIRIVLHISYYNIMYFSYSFIVFIDKVVARTLCYIMGEFIFGRDLSLRLKSEMKFPNLNLSDKIRF